jgi:hypothetical protein
VAKKKVREFKRGFGGKQYRVLWNEPAVACPRCGKATQIREHRQVGEKLLQQPYYYSRWFYCVNKACPTKQIMREEHKVMNVGAAAERCALQGAGQRPLL